MARVRQSVFYPFLGLLLVLIAFVATVDGWSGSGTIESGQMYLIAPAIVDCPATTFCDTLASYSATITTDVVDVTFTFLPGIHTLPRTWIITNSSNITLRSQDGFAMEGNDLTKEVMIVCESNFTGSELLQVHQSEGVYLDDISMLSCESTFFTLNFNGSQQLALSNVRVICSDVSGGNDYRFDVYSRNCQNVIIVNSTFDSCRSGVHLFDVKSLVIERVFLSSHYSCDGLDDRNSSRGVVVVTASDVTVQHVSVSAYCYGMYWEKVYHGVVENVGFFDNYITGLYADNCEGEVTFERLTVQGCSYGIALFGVFDDVSYTIDSVSVTSGTSHSRAGLYLQNWPHAGLYAAVQTLRIHNVIVSNLAPTSLEELEDSFYAAIVVYFLKTVTVSNVTVENNGLTGMHIIDSTVYLRDDILVKKNSGISGGGMSLSANSVLVMDSSTRLQLHDNHANQFGGGIYVSQDYTWQRKGRTFAVCFTCAIEKVVEPIVFRGNAAGVTGDDLYGGFTEECIPPVVNGIPGYLVNMTDDIVTDNCSQTRISSDPVRVLRCNGSGCVDDSVKDEHPQRIDLPPIYPGEEYSLTIAAVGQQNGLTQAVISLTSQDIFFHSAYSKTTVSVDAKCTTVSYTLELSKYVAQARLQVAIEDNNLPAYTNIPIEVTISVLPCPLGFNLSSYICQCSDLLQSHVTCDITTETLYRETRDPWISLKTEYTILFKKCPFDYCLSNASFPVGDLDQQCDLNRSGVLCGECLEGYSLILGSNQCRNCSSEVWPAFVIVLGSAIVGIGLIALLIALNLTVTAGTLNGVLFFANVVKIYEPFFPLSDHGGLFHYWSAWLNLDLGIPSCFVDQMAACGKVALQFVFPLYLVALVFAIMVICKAGQCRGLSSLRLVRFVSKKLTKLIGPKAIPILATLLLLSYTKLLRIVILVFHRSTLRKSDCDQNASSSSCDDEIVWSYDGNIGYLSCCHGGLVGLALGIVSPFLVLYTLFLLFFPLMERLFPRVRRLRFWHMLLKPWYDAYGGPYKDRYRSWNGVLLLARAGLALFSALVNDPVVNLSVLAWVSLFLVSAFFLTQPYKAFHHNFLEMLFLSSLLFMAFAAVTDHIQIDLLLILALITLLLITSYHAYLQLKKLPPVMNCWRVFKYNFDSGNTVRQNMEDTIELPELWYFRDMETDVQPMN